MLYVGDRRGASGKVTITPAGGCTGLSANELARQPAAKIAVTGNCGVCPDTALQTSLTSTDVSLTRLAYRVDRESQMLARWLSENRLAVRVVTSSGGMIALAVVLAAPSKWS
jgi:hypothetical protein